MVKFENLWLFERSEFQRFSNFIIAQCLVEIRAKPERDIIYLFIRVLQRLLLSVVKTNSYAIMEKWGFSGLTN